MMTLVSSARRHDLDVGLYLKDVLDQLLAGSTDYEALRPDIWKVAHPDAVRTYRDQERRYASERKSRSRQQPRPADASSRAGHERRRGQPLGIDDAQRQQHWRGRN